MSEDVLWADLLSVANILFAFLLAGYSIGRIKHNSGFSRVMMIVYSIIGIYWGCLYLVVLLSPPGVFDPVWFGRIFVRPAFTFTLAAMCSITLYRWKSRL